MEVKEKVGWCDYGISVHNGVVSGYNGMGLRIFCKRTNTHYEIESPAETCDICKHLYRNIEDAYAKTVDNYDSTNFLEGDV